MITAKGKTGSAMEMVIEQVLSQPQIFVFGEFLALPQVKDVSIITLTSYYKTVILARSEQQALQYTESLRL